MTTDVDPELRKKFDSHVDAVRERLLKAADLSPAMSPDEVDYVVCAATELLAFALAFMSEPERSNMVREISENLEADVAETRKWLEQKVLAVPPQTPPESSA